jgi:hypothetical protein
MDKSDKQTIALIGSGLIIWFLMGAGSGARSGILDTDFNVWFSANHTLMIIVGIIFITVMVLWAFHESPLDKAIKAKRWGL